MRVRRSPLALALPALLLAGGADARADVYVSHSPGEPPKFANHRIDSSYRLFFRDEHAARIRSPAPNAAAGVQRRSGVDAIIERVATKHAVDAALVRAVIEVESRFDSRAISPKGAAGMMQLMPETARRYGVDNRSDAVANIEGGVAYLRDLLGRFGGNVALALAAYNAGEGAVDRHHGGIPRYRETMLYVPRVLEAYARYREERNVSSP
jgi:soluble lytic murein transglycosylase-like protein